MTLGKIKSIGGCAGLAGAIALAVLVMPARAASPVFPLGSRVGLIPPAGMGLSKTFPGFEDPAAHAMIFVGALPVAAFAELKQSNAAEVLKKQGIEVQKRQSLRLAIGDGILVTGKQVTADKIRYRRWFLVAGARDLTALVSVQVPEGTSSYTDSVVRAALATLAVRASVPGVELLSMLPFTIGNLAGFHVGNVIPGRAVLLTDAPKIPHMIATNGIPQSDLDARVIVAAVPGSPSGDNGRADLARLVFGSIGGIKDVQITMSEPVRIEDHAAFETVAQAKDVRTGGNVMVVQWLRFAGRGFLQIAGISRAEIWDSELTRMRAIRDSIELK